VHQNKIFKNLYEFDKNNKKRIYFLDKIKKRFGQILMLLSICYNEYSIISVDLSSPLADQIKKPETQYLKPHIYIFQKVYFI